MEKLTKAEEPIMHIIWKKEYVFVKDIVSMLPDSQPYNTVSSIVRILESKGMVSHEAFGRTHRYFAKVTKFSYSQFLLKNVLSNYFDGSYKNLVSTMVKEENLSKEDILELKKFIYETL